MIEDGAGTTRAAQWRHLSLDLVQAERARRRQLGQGWGAIFDAWDVVPPKLPSADAPAEAQQLTATEATRRVRALAPADADADEVQLLIAELLAGATDEQALDHLAFVRAQRSHLARAIGEASPWERLLSELQARIGRVELAQHFRGARLAALDEGRAVVAVPTVQAKTAIESRYLTTIADVLGEIQQQAMQVRIVIQPTASL